MSRYWSDVVKRLEPYVPGEQPKDKKYIKLNTNENPYPPSPAVIEAIEGAADGSLRLYPDPNCDALREIAAKYYGVEKENVFVGNGSDELLAFSFMAFFNPGKAILFPDITYSFYPVYARLFNIDYKTVPLDSEFNIPVELFNQDNGGIIFPNPNAPTGRCLDLEQVRSILEHNPDSVVVVDEAYIAFGGESAVGLTGRYPNLLVIQTLSKSHSLAGLRVGFAIGHRDLVEGINRVKNSVNSYTLDRIALAGAAEALKDSSYFEKTRSRIMATRERVTAGLRNMGFRVIDSLANFVFISHPEARAAELFARLREKGILVRYFNMPRIDNYLRVTIGTDEEMDILLYGLKEIIGHGC